MTVKLRTTRSRSMAVVALMLSAAGVGCSADHYRRDADEQVYGILQKRSRQLFGEAGTFSIEEARDRLRLELLEELAQRSTHRMADFKVEVVPEKELRAADSTELASVGELSLEEGGAAEGAEDSLLSEGQEVIDLEERLADIEVRYARELTPLQATDDALLPVQIVSLEDCLQIAADNSRDYQTEKERVYLAALDLTFQRYQFETQYGVATSYDYINTPEAAASGRRREGTLTTSLSFTRMLATGGLVVFDFTNALVRRFTGFTFTNGSRTSVGSVLDLSITQPLLRGFGADIVQEPLVQAEREVIYAMRNFARFRQEFAVSVSTEYYGLLQLIDAIENSRRSYLQFINAREQSEARADRGRRSQIQVDQALQSELRARNTWIRTLQSFEDALDRFKITLGLPIEAHMQPDPEDFSSLRDQGLSPVEIREREAIELALGHRYDYRNELDRMDDRERQLNVARDDLRAVLDVSGSYSVPTDRDTVFDLAASGSTWTAGVNLNLPVDRLAERNIYRRALINVAVQERQTTLLEDRVKQSVRDSLRLLARLRESYEIELQSVVVAERRVESTSLFLGMGRIEIRDALEATDALAQARNALTAALVNFQIGQLELFRDVGTLQVTPEGLHWQIPPPAERGEP